MVGLSTVAALPCPSMITVAGFQSQAHLSLSSAKDQDKVPLLRSTIHAMHPHHPTRTFNTSTDRNEVKAMDPI